MRVDTEFLQEAIDEIGSEEVLARVRTLSQNAVCLWKGLVIGRREEVLYELRRIMDASR